MIDRKYFRLHAHEIAAAVAKKGYAFDSKAYLDLEKTVREKK